jgi:aspartate kinase
MKFAVAKFGGTSMADAKIILQSAKVVSQKKEIRLCVISATAGSTNQLMTMAEHAKTGQIPQSDFQNFEQRHQIIAQGLEASSQIKESIHLACKRVKELLEAFSLLRHIPKAAMDEIASQGEIISSHLFCAALKIQGIDCIWVDARDIMKTTSDYGRAIPHLDLLKKNAEEKIKPHLDSKMVVTQGYIGSDLENRTTTLGKEGSDYSTALFAEALGASEVQIWKDVPGIMTTDPRLVPTAKTLHYISFEEVAELTRFGAKVIHPDTFLPVIRQGIPLYVGYSQDPSLPGTKITAMSSTSTLVHALSLKKDVTLLKLKTEEKLDSLLPFLPPYIHLMTSNQKVLVVLDKLNPLNKAQQKSLSEKAQVEISHSLDLIALVGASVTKTQLIQELTTLIPLTFTVTSGEGENILKKLHHHFLERS